MQYTLFDITLRRDMKILMLMGVFLIGCTFQGPKGAHGDSCTTITEPYGARIQCTDGSYTNIYNGKPVAVSVTPADASTCPTGGVVYSFNSLTTAICNGAVGPQGVQGLQGTTGLPGTSIGIIQFCPGNTTYPGNFQEVGFVIGDMVYAVYSANDGFLTYIPPGTYRSNAIGNSCKFTLHSDNTVTY